MIQGMESDEVRVRIQWGRWRSTFQSGTHRGIILMATDSCDWRSLASHVTPNEPDPISLTCI